MNKVFCFTIQIFLISSLSHADAVLSRPAFTPGGLIGLSKIGNWGPSALILNIASLIQSGFEKSKKIEQEADTWGKLLDCIGKREKSYERIRQERTQRIRELKKKIFEAHSYFLLNEEESLEDMLAELSDLLEKPAESEIGFEEDNILLWDSKPDIFKQLTLIDNFIVPGMRMAPAKKSDRSAQKEPERKAPLAPAQEESEALQTTAPASVSVAPPGSAQITIPTVVLPLAVFQQLQTENAILRNENAELKQQIQIIYKRDVEKLQSEVTRLEGDNSQLHRDINLLREENEILRRENQQLKERLAVLERELGDTQKVLFKLQVSHDSLKERFDRHQYTLEIGQALGYVNDEIRRVFDDPAIPGFPGTQRMARRNEFRDDEPRIWADFVRAHPGADNIAFARIFAEIMVDRVGLAHPTHVDQMNREELKRHILAVKPDLQESVAQSFVDFVYTFHIPRR